MSVVPVEWCQMIASLATAQVARDVMRSPTAHQVDRDIAAVEYTRAADAVIDNLAVLRGAQVLGRFTQFLARKERG